MSRPKGQTRSNRPSLWRGRSLRHVAQLLSLSLFLLLFLAAYHPVAGFPVDLFLRADPLIAIATSISSRQLVTAIFWAVPLIVLALVTGRAFCGWLCPLGALLDLENRLIRRGKAVARKWPCLRTVKYVVLSLLLGSSLAGATALLALDPMSLLTRSLATALWPLLDLGLRFVQQTLYEAELAPDLWVAIDTNLRGKLLPLEAYEFGQLMPVLILAVLVFALTILAPRFWCRYICPLGATLSLLGMKAPVQRRLNSKCIHCGRCVRVCPTAAINTDDHRSQNSECTLCLNCADVCPADAITFTRTSDHVRPLSASRRQLLVAAAAGLVGVGTVAIMPGRPSTVPGQVAFVRPPGAGEQFLQRCVRCGECVKVCPTGGLHQLGTQAGGQGIWTPALISRSGYCDYNCTDCGSVCPSNAITALPLSTKRLTVIGQAHVDQQRCLPYAEGTACIVCEEMCPLPDKAIKLTVGEVRRADGSVVAMQLPEVLPALCIGCGLCEFHCPVEGRAAIEVTGVECQHLSEA